jgi:choline dehydrogenase-like flavoprotein
VIEKVELSKESRLQLSVHRKSALQRHPDLHRTHAGMRIEALVVAFHQVGQFTVSVAGLRKPGREDVMGRVGDPGNVPAMDEDRVTLPGQLECRKAGGQGLGFPYLAAAM